MKYFYLLVIVFFAGCSSGGDDELFETPAMMEKGTEEEILEEVKAGVGELIGAFVSDAHTTTGTAVVNKEKTILSFTNFKTDPGPKLLIYLSKTKNSIEFVDLGDIKGVDGNYAYDIPDGTNLSQYKFVSIWCVDFLVSFGHAELK